MFASVLRDRHFVQMPTAAQNKFKLSVACALHLAARKVPNWNKSMFLLTQLPLKAAICR
jgi:hypothetical protein